MPTSLHDKSSRGPARVALLLSLTIGVLACRARPDDSRNSTKDAAAIHEAPEAEALPSNQVTLSEAAYQSARIVVAPVIAEGAVAAGGDISVPGQVEANPARVALISPRTPARIERLAVVEGERVRNGQVVATLSSPAVLTAETDYVQATRRARLLEGTADEEGALALAEAARRRLELLGVSDDVRARLDAGMPPAITFTLAAPFAGSIVQSSALVGTQVEAGTPIFRLEDLSTVNVIARLPERALSAIAIGQPASVQVPAYPDTRFPGRIERLKDEVDPGTRTIPVVIRVRNSNHRLRPGMFATVELPVRQGASGESEEGRSTGTMTIPETAIVTVGDTSYVFVAVGPRRYERRAVRLLAPTAAGATAGSPGSVRVLNGLTAGEQVVIRGAFVLKAELGKAAFAEEDEGGEKSESQKAEEPKR